MPSEILIALLSLLGTLGGSLLGILSSNRLTTHRIKCLEEKMDKHNGLMERMVVVERDQNTLFRYKDDHENRIRAIESET